MNLKRHVRNASVVGALLTGGLAVTTIFCSKKNISDANHLKNISSKGIGSWSLQATSENITMTIDTCLKDHSIYCEYEITKYNAQNIAIGVHTNLSGGACKNNYQQINDSNPCDINQADMGFKNEQAAYYKFNKAKCYDTTQNNTELIKNTKIPTRVNCQ